MPEVRELQRLVGPGVQGAHDNAPVTEGLEDLGVRGGLLFEGRHGVAVEEQELGAEQTDALHRLLGRLPGVVGRADVGEERHRVAVLGCPVARAPGEGRSPPTLPLLQQFRLLGRRVHCDLANPSIDGHQGASGDLGDPGGLHHGRDAQL